MTEQVARKSLVNRQYQLLIHANRVADKDLRVWLCQGNKFGLWTTDHVPFSYDQFANSCRTQWWVMINDTSQHLSIDIRDDSLSGPITTINNVWLDVSDTCVTACYKAAALPRCPVRDVVLRIQKRNGVAQKTFEDAIVESRMQWNSFPEVGPMGHVAYMEHAKIAQLSTRSMEKCELLKQAIEKAYLRDGTFRSYVKAMNRVDSLTKYRYTTIDHLHRLSYVSLHVNFRPLYKE